jgi:uncharacterized protein (DUF2141 family)
MNDSRTPGIARGGAHPLRAWAGARLVVGVVLLADTLLAPSAIAEQAAAKATIRAQLKGLKSDSGQAGCTIFSAPDGFPNRPEIAIQRRWVPIKGRAAVCEFVDLPPGGYALAAIHDDNGNGKLDKNAVGKPTEGVGVSRDARPGLMSPPTFGDAVLPFKAGTSTIDISIRY